MCTLKKSGNAENTVSNRSHRDASMSACATKAATTTSQTLVNPVVCHKCKALHYSYSLACKVCGDYFHTQHQQVGEPKFQRRASAIPIVMTLFGTIIGAVLLLRL